MKKQMKKDTSSRWFWIVACLVPVIILSVVVSAVIINEKKNQFEGLQVKADQTYANAITVYTNESAPVVTLYEDPLCPYCRNLEQTSSKDLLDRVKKGEIQLQYKVVNILDRASDTGDYSSRVLGAYISITKNEKNPEIFNKFHQWVYAHQPREGSSLSQDELVKGMTEAGASDATVNWYKKTDNWLNEIPKSVTVSTQEISQVRNGQVGVPTVIMNDKLINTDQSNWVKNLG